MPAAAGVFAVTVIVSVAMPKPVIVPTLNVTVPPPRLQVLTVPPVTVQLEYVVLVGTASVTLTVVACPMLELVSAMV